MTLVAAIQAVNNPTKVEYNFNFDVRTGTARPVPFASGFVLKGKLVVYAQGWYFFKKYFSHYIELIPISFSFRINRRRGRCFLQI